MRSAFIAVGALLTATVAAQPHRYQHRHAKHPAKRADNVVWVTENVDVYETELLTATVWVDQQGSTISPAVTGTGTGSPARSTNASAGVFNEPEVNSTSAPVVAPTPTPASAPASIPASSPAPVPTSAPSTATVQVSSVAPAPAPSSSAAEVPPPATLNVAPTSTLVPVVSSAAPVPVASSASEAAPASTTVSTNSAAASSGSSTGECSSGSPCNGDITFYEAGLGACGDTTDGETDLVVALPVGLMGDQSNGNPYCGKTVTISKGGATVQAKVVDKCMGCVGTSLDLSNAAFSALGINYDVGRTTADWYFN